MEQTTFNRIKMEMQSFKGLIITNLIGGAFTIAFSISYAIPKVIPLIEEGALKIEQLPYIGLMVAGFVVAINWITKSAELMEEHDEIVKELEDVDPSDDEAVTGIIVQSLAFYRGNQRKIQQLGIVSRIVGGFLLLTAVPQVQALLAGAYPLGRLMAIGQVFGLIATVGAGAAGLYVPTLLQRFAAKWDARLNSAEEAEEKLDRILQG